MPSSPRGGAEQQGAGFGPRLAARQEAPRLLAAPKRLAASGRLASRPPLLGKATATGAGDPFRRSEYFTHLEYRVRRFLPQLIPETILAPHRASCYDVSGTTATGRT